MAPSYKLVYFDIRGRAEISRLVFAAAGKTFEDKRIGFEDWPKVKPTTPTGSLPMLEVGGKSYAQGLAIATFLAREFGLYGKTNTDGLAIDGLQQQREDLLIAQSKVGFEKDEAKKAEGEKTLMEDQVPKTFKYFCDMIKAHGGRTGYAVGDKLSLGDIVIYEGTQLVADSAPKALEEFPAIVKLRKLVESSSNIQKYLSSRKKTDF